ncbi:MAG: hypothetical protein AAFX81_19445 [Pseudomonadota bacterium]
MACDAPIPTSAAAIAAPLADVMAYEETIHHPSSPEPLRARGSLRATPEGSLVRDQTHPTREIAEIGPSLLGLRKPPDFDVEYWPLEEAAQAQFGLIRALLSGRLGEAVPTADIRPDESGWRLTAGEAVALTGCGSVVSSVEVVQEDGVRRVYVLTGSE